jgi:hypothetical protein
MMQRNGYLWCVNCLEEWQTGAHIKIPFSGDQYEIVYQDITQLIVVTGDDAYHGQKLHKNLQFIATDGQYVNFSPPSFPSIFIYIIGNVHHIVVAILGAVHLRLD